MQLGLFLGLHATQQGGQPALGDVVIAGGDVVYSWSSIDDDTVTLIVTSPADYAGSYDINLTDLATAPQLIRVAPAPTGTQALGETLTGRPALWAVAEGQTIDIERRWWKGNGPLLDRGGYPPLGLTCVCEWHSDAQEPFRIDERARYVADPEATWSAWHEGDETTPPDPSPFLAGSFVDPATRELWACTPYTTHVGLLQTGLTEAAVRSLDDVRRFNTVNPNGAALPFYDSNSSTTSILQVRNNALFFNPGRAPRMSLASPTVDWGNRTDMTSIQAYMFTMPSADWPFSEPILMHIDGGTSVRLSRSGGKLIGRVGTSAGSANAEDADWFTNYYGTPSPTNPTIVVIGMRRKDDITSLWTNGVAVTPGSVEFAGTTIVNSSSDATMAAFTTNGSNPENINALVGMTFFAAYGLSDTEMVAVMNHIARAVGVPT